ncbi:MAG: VWA domain-containing protein [Acidobacteria bacterium]|nr:VWA domain-containing protein [Acidobacteriota bacterium]
MSARKRTSNRVAKAWCVVLFSASLMGAGQSTPQAATLRLSNAPITIEYPESWRDWAVSLAAYADAAAATITEMTGSPIPTGTVRWEPASSGPGSSADGVVEVSARGAQTLVTIRTNVPLLQQDYGASYALGYGRWLGAYVVGRVAMGASGGSAPWWTEGAALYLTDRIFRESQATTPVLYGVEGNFTRAAQSRRPVDLSESPLSPAARGKAYATFKLIEAIYGQDASTSTIGRLIGQPSDDLAAIVDAIGRDRTPDPDRTLRDWLEPTVNIDIGLQDVALRDGNEQLRGQLKRRSPIDMPVVIEAQCADGSFVQHVVEAGREDVRFEMDVPCEPTSVTVDPLGLVPDINRANNRFGFGDAEQIRRFFAFDDRFSVGELVFNGEVGLDPTQQREESFRLRLTNRTDDRSGVGILVSAEWFDRAERVQRAYFIDLEPGETRIVDEALAYPNRGSGHAQVTARFWEASSVEDLTDKIVGTEPGAMNSYIVVREAPDAPRRPQRGLYLRPPSISTTEGEAATEPAERASEAPVSRIADSASGPDDASANESVPDPTRFGVRLTSPQSGTLPIGDVNLTAVVTTGDADYVDFFVNERRVGRVEAAPYRLPYTFSEDERVFVIRAVAVADDNVASIETILDRAAIQFGSTVNLVTVHATIRDAAGRIVRDLSPDEVRVVEDGVQQEIEQFDFGEVPVSAALLLDQSSSMIGGGIRAERAGAARLIDSLVSDINRAMVLGFDDRVYMYTDFTHDKAELEAGLAAIDPDGSTALFDTLAESIRKVNRRSGKRAVIVLSDGLDTHSEFAYEDVLEYLRQSEPLVYTIGIQLMHEGTELGDASGAVKRGVEQLRAFADSTGGAAYFPLQLTELEEIYGLIADELNSQYAISYYPRNTRYDGAFRRVRIEVPGRPGVWVQVREGYYGVRPEER